MSLKLISYAYFICGICGGLFSHFAQKIFGPSALFCHGKSQSNLSSFSWISSLTVSKRKFWHFYALGLVGSVFALKQRGFYHLPAGLLAVQCLRRLLECFWVMPGAKKSQMHLIHYLIGISYYPMLLLSFDNTTTNNNNDDDDGVTVIAWIGLFVIASILQFYCHWILGSERANISNENSSNKVGSRYRPINNPIFKFIHAPHYFAEFLIYASLAGLQGFPPLSLLNLAWILVILGVSAVNSADWLCETCKFKSRKEFCKYLMIPFLF